MRVVIPIWADHVSPVLDVARRVRLVHVDKGKVLSETHEELPRTDLVRTLMDLGADVLICGAVSSQLADRLRACGCDVVHEICGPVDEVVEAFLDGQLEDERFAMPGCCSHQPLQG